MLRTKCSQWWKGLKSCRHRFCSPLGNRFRNYRQSSFCCRSFKHKSCRWRLCRHRSCRCRLYRHSHKTKSLLYAAYKLVSLSLPPDWEQPESGSKQSQLQCGAAGSRGLQLNVGEYWGIQRNTEKMWFFGGKSEFSLVKACEVNPGRFEM